MKKISILLIALLSLSSCDSSELYPVVCKIDNVPWSAASAPTFSGTFGLAFNATNNQNSSLLAATMPDFNIIGTHAIDSPNVFSYTNDGVTYQTKTERPGILKIIDFDSANKRVRGEFSVMLFSSSDDSISLTEGKFNLKYQ